MSVAVLIVAAGRGRRAGGSVPKQYASYDGVPLLRKTILSFYNNRLIDVIKVVIHPEDRPLYDASASDLDLSAPCPGGETRQDSVRLGLEALADEKGLERVLIHDGARPFVSGDLIARMISALDEAPAAIPGLPVTDTLKEVDANLVVDTPDRARFWRVQTPQAFDFKFILEAHRKLQGEALTDDAAVAEKAGMTVKLVKGDERNIKITTPQDMDMLNHAPSTHRVGFGYDVHRLGPGNDVTLCGVKIAHNQGLIGHSDADVALHALTDALLGAIGAGDIGVHFPPSQAKWKDVSSKIFVDKAASLIDEAGGTIENVDITLICENPKISPHSQAMKDSVADMLDLTPEAVNIKATTTERLGFTGRGEGIAAQAVAMVRLPAGPAGNGVRS